MLAVFNLQVVYVIATFLLRHKIYCKPATLSCIKQIDT